MHFDASGRHASVEGLLEVESDRQSVVGMLIVGDATALKRAYRCSAGRRLGIPDVEHCAADQHSLEAQAVCVSGERHAPYAK
jgi:hypothetical protein